MNLARKPVQDIILSEINIPAGHDRLPIEIRVLGKFPDGTTKAFLESAFSQQKAHVEYIDEFHEQSALIGKPTFYKDDLDASDPTAVYSFGVDTRDLVFHTHAGHRVITGITGDKGCVLKFSLCLPEEAEACPQAFLDKLHIVHIPGNRLFSLRFNGTVYHQFSPVDYSENAFFAVSVHTNEAGGLSGELLEKVLASKGSIPLLTEPATKEVLKLMTESGAYNKATSVYLDAM